MHLPRIKKFILFQKLAANMTENNKKKLPVKNNNGSGNSKRGIQRQYKEINHGCGCGAASCENCPIAFGMVKGDSDRDAVYRKVFLYLMIMMVILVITCIANEVLSLLLV